MVEGSRRERLRAQTVQEIKETAMALLAEGGPGAVTLRAIGRRMGMTAGALYGYYATRDDLLTSLIDDVYTALMDEIDKACDAVPADDAAGRLMAWARTFRAWATGNPEGFRLVYGEPVPDYRPPPGGPAPEAARRACAGLVSLVAAAWPYAGERSRAEQHDWSDFGPGLADEVRASHPGLPPAAVAVALRVWGRMHGLVALEVHGHLRAQARHPEKLYREEMRELVASLGLPAGG
ncbi:TetR/AcrR family transcriptional regulator [Nonomuraea sp. PA05]|uniref:TetR/AcrR family transcriptional regulator n=1 Tax=Nonomuraea sp. PA05 TaxID=2604466 RepID=UPI0021CCC9B0|nr:TetR/AcrR family transcriptional regulator [Nonomuraea sp. PA05]